MWLTEVLTRDLRKIATPTALFMAAEIEELLTFLEEQNYGGNIRAVTESYEVWKVKEGNDIEKDQYYIDLLARLHSENDGLRKQKTLLLRRARVLVKRAENKSFWIKAAAEHQQARAQPSPTPPPTASPPPPAPKIASIFRPWQK
jgi:hypothetical protein